MFHHQRSVVYNKSIMMVSAAPNKCILTGIVRKLELKSEAPPQFTIELEVLNAANVEDMPNFGRRHIGSTVRATTSEDVSELTKGATILCDAEYVGGPFSGVFRLSNFRESS